MIVGQLEIQMLANMARLQADMDAAKRTVGVAMAGIESAVEGAKSALLGLAAGLTVGAFAAIVKGSIDASAGLHDMSIQTGASVASLAAFRSVAATTDTSIQGIAGAMNKMSKVMAVANEDSKGVGVAVKALGLDFSTLKNMKPEDQMLAVAKAMNQFEDGTDKAAVAMTLYGKEGAKMLPFLKDLAEESDSVVKKMTEQEVEAKRVQASMADDFGDNLTKIKKASDAWKKDVAMAMLPALYELSQAFRDVTEGPTGVKAEIGKLAADGSITHWTRVSIESLTYVMDAFAGLKAVTISLGESMGFMAASIMLQFDGIGKLIGQVISGDFAGAAETYKTTTLQQQQMTEDFHATLDKTWGEQTLGSKLRDRMGELQQVGYAAKAAKDQLKFDAGGDGISKEAARLREEQAKLMAEMAGLSGNFSKDWNNLTLLFKSGALNMEQLVEAQAKLLAKQPAIKAMYESELKAAKEIAEARQTARVKEDEGIQKYLEAQQEGYNKAVKGSNDALKAAQEQYDQYGLSKAQIAEVTLLTLQADQAKVREGSDGYAAIQKQIDAQKKLIVVLRNTEGLDEQKSMWTSIEQAAHSTFTNVLQGGQDMGTKLLNSLKAGVGDWLYQMTLKKWIFNLSASTSGSGVANAAFAGMGGSGGDAGGMGSVLGSLFSAGGAISEGITGIGAAMMNGPLSSMLGDMGASLVANSSAIAGAIPYVGAALAAVGILKNVMDYKVEATGNALTATVGATGVLNGKVGTRADFTQTGGFMGGGVTKNSSWSVADANTTNYINAAVQNVTATNAAYAAILGLNASALDGYTKALDINITGMDAAAAQTAINTEVQKFGVEQVTAAYGEALAQYAKAGETVFDTLKRLAGIEVASVALNEFGGIFSRIATLGIDGRDSMIQLAGGIEALVKKSSDFVKLYYSSDEQNGIQARTVLNQLNAAGVTDASQLSNKEEFRALVESIDVSNQSGREQLNALLTIAPQFAQVSEYLKTNNIDLGDLAKLAPAIAALDPLFQQSNDAATSNANAATDATTSAIDSATEAINSNTSAVVAAVNGVATAVAAAVREGMAAAGATGDQVAKVLDSIDSSRRLELAGG